MIQFYWRSVRRRRIKKLKRPFAIFSTLSIHATDIRVHGSPFYKAWVEAKDPLGHQAAIRLHLVWDIDGQWVDDFLVTPVRCGEFPTSHKLKILAGKMYVFDRGYVDYLFKQKIVNIGSHFVTRLKTSKKRSGLENQLTGLSGRHQNMGF